MVVDGPDGANALISIERKIAFIEAATAITFVVATVGQVPKTVPLRCAFSGLLIYRVGYAPRVSMLIQGT